MNDAVYVNNKRLSDVLESIIIVELREHGYKSDSTVRHVMNAEASNNSFHPIKDYLSNLEWDGIDHIEKLTSYVEDEDGLFPILLRKWLIGAVNRIVGKRPGEHHPMLVMDGIQGLGKSRFVSFLGSPLPAFFIESEINTNDKDYKIYLCSKWIWEVGELETTFKKSDLIALKNYISIEMVDVRPPYGRYPIHKPATASFIGTLNNVDGFLSDPTGNRRFRVCKITDINWSYSKEVNVNQVWAQAVALLKSGETFLFSKEEEEIVQEINSRYEQDDPLLFPISGLYEIDPADIESFLPAAEILQTLKNIGVISGGFDKVYQARIAGILTKLGCKSTRKYVNGIRMRVWQGIKIKNNEEKKSMKECVESIFDGTLMENAEF